jgi:hypothetical protein
MLADYFTKPLQGKQFHLFRDVIMGYKHISILNKSNLPSLKERVVKCDNEECKKVSNDKLILENANNGNNTKNCESRIQEHPRLKKIHFAKDVQFKSKPRMKRKQIK